MQVAAVGSLILIAFLIYSFTHIPVPEAPKTDDLPVITVSAPYRQKLPQFEWSNTAGSHLATGDFQGGWTLLTFWSSTCAPCLHEMPDLDQFNEDWSGPELKIVSVNVDPSDADSTEATKKFLADNDMQLPVYYDPSGDLKKIFDVHEIPRHFLISPNGEIIWEAKGAFQWTSPESQQALLSMMEREKSDVPK